MQRALTFLKRTIVGAAAVAAFATAPSLLSAQETTTTEETTATTTASAEEDSVTTSSELERCEAVQRTNERYRKWIEEGVPEEFGSEEPFTFDPDLC